MSKLRVDKIAAPIVKDEFTGSVYFDGYGSTAGGYLEIPKAPFQFLHKLTDSWTVECWVYKGKSDQGTIFDTGGSSSTTIGTAVYINSDNTIRLRIRQALSATVVSENYTIADPVHGWNHFALSFDGSKFRIFWNGVSLGEVSYSTESATDSTQELRIGVYKAAAGFSGYWNGYISNFRICKGHAVYTENFTPPTRELSVHTAPPKGVVFPAADNRTVLLACQSSTDATLDSSGRHTITGAGNLGGVPGQNLVTNGQFGQNVDNWVVSGSISFARDTTVFSDGGIKVTTGGGQSLVTQTLTGLVVGVRYTLSADLYTPSSNPGTDVATISIVNASYNDGSAISTGTNGIIQRKSFAFTASGTSQVIYLSVVRADYASFAPSGSIGYFDNISVIADTPISEANPGLFRKTNITSTITENTGSVFFDGSSGNNLTISSSGSMIGTGDFTVEFFIYSDSTADRRVFSLGANNADGSLVLMKDSDGIRVNWETSSSTGGSLNVVGSGWHHVAAVRSNNNLKIYIDGELDKDHGTVSVNFNASPLYIGDDPTISNQELTGYISNLRIVRLALYTSQFIPPTRELEVTPETTLLACYDGENIFAEKTGKIIAAYGDRLSSPTPTATDSPIGITTNNPGLTRNVDPTAGPTFQGGVGFVSQNWLTLPKGTTTERNPKLSNAVSHGSARGIFGAIQLYPNSSVTIHYSTIATFGNTVDFGDLNESRRYAAGCSSKTRGLFGGGSEAAPGPAKRDSIDYITIATTGNANDFGDLTEARWAPSAFSNSTRGIFFSGNISPANTNVIDYVTISTLGDALDFGDAFSDRRYTLGSTSDTTRGIDAGGHPASYNVIQYVTFASTGNSQDFGDLMQVVNAGCGGVSNGTRGVFAGGYNPTQVNTIQYITIQSMGNSKDFGDMTSTDTRHGAAAESSIRGLFTHGGYPSRLNTIDAITIATTGNAVEFGDIIDIGGNDGGGDSGTQSGFSNGHGGLG